MRRGLLLVGWLMLVAGTSSGETAPLEEQLQYSINWPSGLPLGQATLRAQVNPGATPGQEFRLEIEAAVAGFQVRDSYRSRVTSELCSVEFEKDFQHGSKRGWERMQFDLAKGTAVRETLGGGGRSEFEVPECPVDALAFLYLLRRELAQGRVPRPMTVYWGAAYEVRCEYAGRQRVVAGEQRMDSERIMVSIRGPASQHNVEVLVGIEPERRPLVVRVSLPQGTFTMELAP